MSENKNGLTTGRTVRPRKKEYKEFIAKAMSIVKPSEKDGELRKQYVKNLRVR